MAKNCATKEVQRGPRVTRVLFLHLLTYYHYVYTFSCIRHYFYLQLSVSLFHGMFLQPVCRKASLVEAAVFVFPIYSFSVVSQPVSVRKKCCNTADSTFLTARRFTFIFLQFFQSLHLFFSIATFSPFACFLFESDIPHHSLCSQENIFVFILRFVILFSAFVNVCRFFHGDRMSCQIFVTSILIQILCD